MIYECRRTGLRHERAGAGNQDSICVKRRGRLTAVALADGVSTCLMAEEGAETAAQAAADLFSLKGKELMEYDEKDIAEIVTSHVLFELSSKAEEGTGQTEDYSSTLSAVMYDSQAGDLLIYNLGDCIVLAAADGQCSIAAMPYDSSDGCCVTTTIGAASAASVRKMDAGRIDYVVLCSDGAWREMFSKGHIIDSVKGMISEGRFGDLEEYLKECRCEDDNSFAALRIDLGGLS